MGTKRDFVEHFEEAKDPGFWKKGVAGFFSRYRGLGGAVLAEVIASGGSWLAFAQQLNAVKLGGAFVLLAVSLAVVGSTILVWVFFRRRHKQRLCIDWYMHHMAHQMREKVIEAAMIGRSRGGRRAKMHPREFFGNLCDRLAQDVADMHKELLDDGSVCCAIRLADRAARKSKEVQYCTLGRSTGFNLLRADTSEPIPIQAGIPSFFAKKEKHGVLIYHDLRKAAEHDAYKKTVNDEKYPDDLKTFMVAPINGLDGTQKAMLGLLYVTSKGDPWSRRHVDLVGAISDMLGASLPSIINALYSKSEERFGREEE